MKKQGRTIHTKGRVEYEILAELLAELRTKANISQEVLGTMIGRGRSYIWKIENVQQPPDFVAILDIIEATGGDAPTVIAKVQAEARRKQKKDK